MARESKTLERVCRVWFLDPFALIDGRRVFHVWPDSGETLDMQLNAVMRLSVVFAIAVVVATGNLQLATFSVLAGVFFTLTVHRQESFDGKEVPPTCRAPTADNVFMNPLVFDDPRAPAACDITRPDVRRSVDELYQESLFRDVDDVFYAHSAHRQFYTVPSTTTPNDQTQFAKFLYPGVLKPKRIFV